jgi:putative ABC transport system substrate-binding protein
MKRREFIRILGGAAASWPLATRGQEKKVRRVGVLSGLAPPKSIEKSTFSAFIKGMRQLGYVEGRDFVVEWRFADGKYQRYSEFAVELVRHGVDVIVVTASAAIPVVQKTTTTIPIVMGYSIDPVGNGLIASLAHPGGNTTGLASAQEDIISKQLELLVRLKAGLSRVGILSNPNTPNHPGMLKNVETTARKPGLTLFVAKARDPRELEDAFATMSDDAVEAALFLPDSFFNANRYRIAELAVQKRLPSVFAQRDYVEAGGLMCYGESFADFFERSAKFVDKIFKGAKPGDIPVEQPERFFLVVNLKTAKSLSLTVPSTLLETADEVIE